MSDIFFLFILIFKEKNIIRAKIVSFNEAVRMKKSFFFFLFFTLLYKTICQV